ncbi:UNVERIFIED_CONTAM: hypothetical protein RMT77_015586 [Armadillidium vulgare]
MVLTYKNSKGPRQYYQIDNLIHMNCTSYKTKPKPKMVWRINGIEVKRTEVKRYPDEVDEKGLITSTLGLQFRAARYFINRRAVVSCMAEIKDHEFYKEEELFLNPSAAFHLYSSGGWRNSFWWQIVSTILVLTQSSTGL